MKSVMQKDFARLPRTDIKRSTFDRSHGLKTAFDSGYLVPIFVDEILPGDEFAVEANMLARLAPAVTPPMDNVFLDTQWFFCPSRLLWNNFTKMMGERVNPNDSIDYLVPTLNSGETGFAVGSLADYLGIPTGVANLDVNALPFRMYAKVWDDWYRDENLQNSIIQSSDDLGDSAGTIPWNTLLKRGKRHDYFTSCLPWPQKGDAVELPLAGDTVPVVGNGYSLGVTDGVSEYGLQLGNVGIASTLQAASGSSGLAVGTTSTAQSIGTKVLGLSTDASKSGLVANLSEATAATINSLRMAFQLQRLLEADARGGCSRYIEIIRQHFSTICPDARLQRSEYLGGSSQLISFAPVAQTSEGGDTPQGNLVSNGKVFSVAGFRKAFTEHGYIIGLANVRCDLTYQQGLDRMWSRKGRYDFYWPTLAHLGEQVVANKEIFAQGADVKDEDGNIIDDLPFGYQERYAEYRYKPSHITGKMRSTAATSLDVWHLAQKFDALPTLSAEFIEDNPPLKRILAVTDEPEIIFDSYIKCICTRPLPTYSIPGLIDHM